MTKLLYSFHWDCGRMGDLEGLFIAEENEIKKLIGKEIYFGEVLGKHSDIYGKLEEDHLKVITDDENVISIFENHFSDNTISGYNPLDFYEPEEDEDDDEEE